MALDILLHNVRSTRLTHLSENILENGLFMLREYLRRHGIACEIENQGRIGFYESLAPPDLTGPLAGLYRKIFEITSLGIRPPEELFLEATRRQQELNAILAHNMDAYLNTLTERIAVERIPVVGMKVWYGSYFRWATRLTGQIRERVPETIVIHGGPHPTIYRAHYLRNGNADLVIFSDGEHALVHVLALIKDLRKKGHTKDMIIEEIRKANIDNIGFRSGMHIKINNIVSIPFTHRTVQKHDTIPEDSLKIGVITNALGCPHNACHFCSYKNAYPEYLQADVQAVVDEMISFVKKGVGLFRYSSGSNLTRHSAQTAEAILKAGLTVRYSLFNRCEARARDGYAGIVGYYRALIRSGLRAVFLGVESGNDAVLTTVMNKGITREDILYTVKAIRAASRDEDRPVDISLSLIYPHPFRDDFPLEQSFVDTLSLVRETSPDSVIPILPFPLPGSRWFTDAGFGFDRGHATIPRPGDTTGQVREELIADELLALEFSVEPPPGMRGLPDITLQGMDMHQMLGLNRKLRAGIRSAGIETDLSDDVLLIARAAGYEGRTGLSEFKRESRVSIMSCDYTFVKDVYRRVNERSRELAAASLANLKA